MPNRVSGKSRDFNVLNLDMHKIYNKIDDLKEADVYYNKSRENLSQELGKYDELPNFDALDILDEVTACETAMLDISYREGFADGIQMGLNLIAGNINFKFGRDEG